MRYLALATLLLVACGGTPAEPINAPPVVSVDDYGQTGGRKGPPCECPKRAEDKKKPKRTPTTGPIFVRSAEGTATLGGLYRPDSTAVTP